MRITIILLLSFIGVSLGMSDALAQDASPLRKLIPGADTATSGLQSITYGIAGLAAIGLGALAFFGRFKWSWFFAIVGGLAVIALTLEIVQSLSGYTQGSVRQEN
jgi:type IV secretory pathway VirB2 component (pilin)